MIITSQKHISKIGPIIIFLSLVLLIVPRVQAAANNSALASIETKNIKISAGKSVVLRSDSPIKRVSIANPDIADFILLSPQEIYITAKTIGMTNLTLWQNGGVTAIYDLVVGSDISDLKLQLHEILPGEKELRVMATNDSITLAGKVSNTANLSQALALVKAYAPEGNVQNLVTVGGVHQVMLEVRVAEMSRTLTRRLGINIFATDGGSFGVSTLGGFADLVTPQNAELFTGPLAWTVSPAVNALFRFDTGSTTWTGLMDALKEDGLIKVLAEPTLITLSGQPANFLAGGEFPVPVPQGLGTVAIEYKPFGVGLVFTPTVLSEDKINILVSPEVSDLDFTTAVQFQGFVVPGLRVRRASTTVELADGQSFAIAGLLRDNVRSITSKFPLLGDLPILGVLFQSKSFQNEKTELVIIVTPHLVKPLDLEKQPLPTDYYVEPNDVDFYLFGKLEGSAKNGAPTVSGEMDGDFGHSIPQE
jgi:pilus assembly protein CpaC